MGGAGVSLLAPPFSGKDGASFPIVLIAGDVSDSLNMMLGLAVPFFPFESLFFFSFSPPAYMLRQQFVYFSYLVVESLLGPFPFFGSVPPLSLRFPRLFFAEGKLIESGQFLFFPSILAEK